MITEMTGATSADEQQKSVQDLGLGSDAALLVLAPTVPGADGGPSLLSHLQDVVCHVARCLAT